MSAYGHFIALERQYVDQTVRLTNEKNTSGGFIGMRWTSACEEEKEMAFHMAMFESQRFNYRKTRMQGC